MTEPHNDSLNTTASGSLDGQSPAPASHVTRIVELIAVFIATPIIMAFIPYRAAILAVLGAGAAVVLILLWRDPAFDRSDFLRTEHAAVIIRHTLLRFGLLAPLMLLFTWLIVPQEVFRFPRENTAFWAIVMAAYPLVSVYPQELVYRAFFFRRYENLFGTGWLMVVASAIAFSFAHLVFLNVVSVVLTAIGGLLFADTYRRSRSLPLVWFEHALFGCWVFTVGLGWSFFGGTRNSWPS